MKIIENKNLNKIQLLHHKRGSANIAIFLKLRELKIGDGLIVSKDEWKGKSLPTHSLSNAQRARGSTIPANDFKFLCRQLADQTGWLIIRIK